MNKAKLKVATIIGTRHGEKHYESLVNRKEMGDYFRIPADNRDLNLCPIK